MKRTFEAVAIVDDHFPVSISAYPIRDSEFTITAWAIFGSYQDAKKIFDKSTMKTDTTRIVQCRVSYECQD